jgi:hypothetical protein
MRSPGVPGGTTKLACPRHPLVRGRVVDGAGTQARHVGAGVGLTDREGTELDLVGGAEALRDPLGDLLGGSVAGDARHGEGAPEDGHGQPGVAPAKLLAGQREGEALGVGEDVGDELPGVEADLGRLLDDGPGRLFALVPLGRSRAQDLLGEVVDPLLDLELILVELQAELGHRSTSGVRGRMVPPRLRRMLPIGNRIRDLRASPFRERSSSW